MNRTVDKGGTIRYKNEKDEYHRLDGPAYENRFGYKEWYINGKLHREDGPSKIWSDGSCSYYLNDKYHTKEEWELEVLKIKLNRLKDL